MSMSVWFATLTDAQKRTVLDDATDEIIQRLRWYMEGLEEAASIPKLEGRKALQAYQSRPPEVWAGIQAGLGTKAYDEAIKDWKRLERRNLGRPSGQSPLSSYSYVRSAAAASPLPVPTLQGQQ